MSQPTHERWLPVVGWEGLYEVSNHGQVRSLDRLVTYKDGRSFTKKGRTMRPGTNGAGHLKVCLSIPGKRRWVYVHTMVLEAFIGERPDGAVARHLDDVPENNSPENLAWGSYSDNMYDKVRNGRCPLSAKTVCVNGHEYTPENTYWYNGGRHRDCKTCRKARARKFHLKNIG